LLALKKRVTMYLSINYRRGKQMATPEERSDLNVRPVFKTDDIEEYLVEMGKTVNGLNGDPLDPFTAQLGLDIVHACLMLKSDFMKRSFDLMIKMLGLTKGFNNFAYIDGQGMRIKGNQTVRKARTHIPPTDIGTVYVELWGATISTSAMAINLQSVKRLLDVVDYTGNDRFVKAVAYLELAKYYAKIEKYGHALDFGLQSYHLLLPLPRYHVVSFAIYRVMNRMAQLHIVTGQAEEGLQWEALSSEYKAGYEKHLEKLAKNKS